MLVSFPGVAPLNGKNFQTEQLIPEPENTIQPFRVYVRAGRQLCGIDNGLVADGAGGGVALEKFCEAAHSLFESRGTFRCLKKLAELAELFTLIR